MVSLSTRSSKRAGDYHALRKSGKSFSVLMSYKIAGCRMPGTLWQFGNTRPGLACRGVQERWLRQTL